MGDSGDRHAQDVAISNQEWGSDFIADLLEVFGFDFVSFNPGASFRGLEESIVNYNDNTPTVIQTGHEGLSVAIAHGYAKATGDPAVCILHDVVGTMHGAMGLYNAYCDRVPLLALSGTGPMRKSDRRPWIEWVHTALVQGDIVREYVKWDDQPMHIDGVAESLLRAHKIANTIPNGPVYVTINHDLQEQRLEEPMAIPDPSKFEPPSKPSPDRDAIESAADLLVDADMPVILTDQVGDSREAVDALVELAELLGAPIVDSRRRRYNFPNTHPLDLTGTEVYRDADVVLALDVWSLNYTLKDVDRVRNELTEAIDGDFDLINVGPHELGASSLTADYYALRETEIPILADTERAIPVLVDAVEERLAGTPSRRRACEKRFDDLKARHDAQRESWQQAAAEQWDEKPVSTARLAGELWDLIRDEEWVLVNGTLQGWAHRLWEIDEFDAYVGSGSGGGGIGYGIGAAIGGALAYADSDRIPINLQSDGDLMYYLCGLWTASHYDLPLLSVVHNNRALYNSTEHRMRLAEYRGRDSSYEQALVGTGLQDPVPDYAQIADAMGVNGYGPIENPENVAPALESAWEDVTNGHPALVDVICQPR